MPTQLALGEEGDMWFTDLSEADDGQNYIGRVDPNGRVEKFTLPPGFNHPDAIARGEEGNMWFTETPDAIGRITQHGEISEFPVPSIGTVDRRAGLRSARKATSGSPRAKTG